MSAGVPSKPSLPWARSTGQPGLSASQAVARRAEKRARQIEPGWYEWILREFLRYWYVLGVLALLVFAPLQMADSPLIGNPILFDVAVVSAIIALLAFGGFWYWFLWKKGGWVDRCMIRHNARREDAADQADDE